jgi:hypothetical protein
MADTHFSHGLAHSLSSPGHSLGVSITELQNHEGTGKFWNLFWLLTPRGVAGSYGVSEPHLENLSCYLKIRNKKNMATFPWTAGSCGNQPKSPQVNYQFYGVFFVLLGISATKTPVNKCFFLQLKLSWLLNNNNHWFADLWEECSEDLKVNILKISIRKLSVGELKIF